MSRRQAVSLFVALSLVWGLSFPAIAVGLDYLPPLLFAAVRYDVAAALLLAYTALRVDDWWPTRRNDRLAILGGGLFLVAGNGLLFVGQQTVPSGVAAIIQALAPILTALWALALLDERLSRLGSVGVLVGFAGIALVVQPDTANLLAGASLGRLLVVLQVVSVSLGGVLVQWTDPSLDRVPLVGWSMLVGAVVLHAASAGGGELPDGGLLDPVALAAIGYLGVVATALAFLAYFYLLEERGAFETNLVTYLVPVVATVVSVLFLDEGVDVLSLVGFGVVALGFALLKRQAIADTLDLPVGRP
ncbi:DMT family transporter [Halobacteriales archaeon Cl-PHB]